MSGVRPRPGGPGSPAPYFRLAIGTKGRSVGPV